MFTALRRFSIFMTMLAEYYFLSNKPSVPVVISIILMVGGALVAAMFDLTFDATGMYIYVYIYRMLHSPFHALTNTSLCSL